VFEEKRLEPGSQGQRRTKGSEGSPEAAAWTGSGRTGKAFSDVYPTHTIFTNYQRLQQ